MRSTAPFLQLPALRLSSSAEPQRLLPLGAGPLGFLRILEAAAGFDAARLTSEEQLQDYFALCLAAHHATVATFVPTDVDSKIRGILWRESRDPAVLRPMFDLALAALQWDQSPISRRVVRGVSGHNGEQLSVLAGAHGRFLETGDAEYAEKSAAAIDDELRREAGVLLDTARERGAELDLLLVAMSVMHNLGDLNQGISFWKNGPKTAESRARFHRLGQENAAPYGGVFRIAAHLYQDTGMSAEGHRHYPLRGVKGLRQSADLLLPLAPFLDDWGARAAATAARVEVLDALIAGCRKIAGQQGYFRAIAGMRAAGGRAFEQAVAALPNGARRDWQSAEIRKPCDVPRVSFESMMRKRALQALAKEGSYGPRRA